MSLIAFEEGKSFLCLKPQSQLGFEVLKETIQERGGSSCQLNAIKADEKWVRAVDFHYSTSFDQS